jgi:hypothetical protein
VASRHDPRRRRRTRRPLQHLHPDRGSWPASATIGIRSRRRTRRHSAPSISSARGSAADAIGLWSKAIAAEDRVAYDEPPIWFYPTRESLGAALLLAGRAKDAERVFREDLARHPRNPKSLFGLHESLLKQSRATDAAWVKTALDEAWKNAVLGSRFCVLGSPLGCPRATTNAVGKKRASRCEHVGGGGACKARSEEPGTSNPEPGSRPGTRNRSLCYPSGSFFAGGCPGWRRRFRFPTSTFARSTSRFLLRWYRHCTLQTPVRPPPGVRGWASRKWTVVGSAAVAFAGVLVAAVLAAGLFPLSSQHLKAAAERKLSEGLGLDVRIADLSVSLFPQVRLSGRGLVFREPSTPDLPPFIEVARFSTSSDILALLRGHIAHLRLEDLRITVPPGEAREALEPPSAHPGRGGAGGDIIVDHLEAHGAVLTILRRAPEDDPLVFRIHELSVREVGFDRAMPFTTALTNPVPEGLVRSEGQIGPWVKGTPGAFPVRGSYTFALANLDTIKGIGGTLTSEGEYAGRLTEIKVTGTTETPDFNLDLGGKPVPLRTTFSAVVDGSNGSTTLERVDAQLFDTPFVVRGTVANLPGPGRRPITLDVRVAGGRIEDVLALVADSGQPLLSGDVNLKSDVSLPPGEGPVRDRLIVKGSFDLASGQFSDAAVRAKLTELSRRSQGKNENERMARVLTRLSGNFALANGVLRLRNVSFSVPGAAVSLQGAYGLENTRLDFVGTLRMRATVSQAVGGFKSIFLRPFDWLFRRDGAGAVVPIRIGGTREKPEMGVRMGSVLTRGK